MIRKILIWIFLFSLPGVLAAFLVIGVKDNSLGFSPPLIVSKGNIKVTFLLGNAYFRNTKEDYAYWKTLMVGEFLEDGYEIQTGKRSKVDISFGEETLIRIGPSSNLHIKEFSVHAIYLELDRGSIYGNFNKLFDKQNILLHTPLAVATIMNAKLSIRVDSAGNFVDFWSVEGLTKIKDAKDQKQQIVLSESTKLHVSNKPMGLMPQKLNRSKTIETRRIIDSLHLDEVLVITDKIVFEKGSYELPIDSYTELNKIAYILVEKNANIRIEGNTDSDGDAEYNKELSMKRAEAIKKYLVENGIDADQLEVRGNGESKPITSNQTKENRSLNRRVEFVVIPKV